MKLFSQTLIVTDRGLMFVKIISRRLSSIDDTSCYFISPSALVSPRVDWRNSSQHLQRGDTSRHVDVTAHQLINRMWMLKLFLTFYNTSSNIYKRLEIISSDNTSTFDLLIACIINCKSTFTLYPCMYYWIESESGLEFQLIMQTSWIQ